MSERFRWSLKIRWAALLLVLSLAACGPGGMSLDMPTPISRSAAGPLLVLTDSQVDQQGDNTYEVEAAQNGHQRWTFTLPAPGLALTAAEGVVYVGAAATVYALDAQTGHLRWSASTSPQVRAIQVIDGLIYVDSGGGFAGQERLIVFSSEGQLRWQYLPPNDQDMPVWLVDSGSFYTVTSGFPAILIAREASTGAERWETPLQIDSPLHALVPAGPDALLVVTQEELVLVQRRDGTQAWQRTQTQAVAAQVIGPTVYAFSVDQPASIDGAAQPVLRALQVSNGSLRWEQPLPASDAGFLAFQQPLVAGTITADGAYLIDGAAFETLHAWNLPDGRTRWTHQADEPLQGLLADVHTVYLAAFAHLLALQATSGQVYWQQANPDDLTTLREEAGLLLGVNPATGVLAALDLTSGQVVWRVQAQAFQQYLLISPVK